MIQDIVEITGLTKDDVLSLQDGKNSDSSRFFGSIKSSVK